MEKLEDRLARRLRTVRGEASLRQFAQKMGISTSTLNRLEMSQQNVTLEILGILCKKLNCDIGDLFPPEDTKEHGR